MTNPRLRDARAADSLKTRSSEGFFSSRTDLNQVLPLFLVTARAKVIRTTSDAVEMEGARGHGKVMEADAEGSEVYRLYLAFEKIFSLAVRQFEVDVCLDSTHCSFADAGLDPLQPLADGSMPIGFRVSGVFAS